MWRQLLKFINWCGEVYTPQMLGKLPLHLRLVGQFHQGHVVLSINNCNETTKWDQQVYCEYALMTQPWSCVFIAHFLSGILELKLQTIIWLGFSQKLDKKQPLKFISWCGGPQMLGETPLTFETCGTISSRPELYTELILITFYSFPSCKGSRSKKYLCNYNIVYKQSMNQRLWGENYCLVIALPM